MVNLISSNNTIVISHKEHIFFELIVTNCLEYEMDYSLKKRPESRLRVLVVTRNKELLENLMNMQLGIEEIFEYSNGYRRFLQKKSIFCDIGSAEYSFVYWSHHLNIYYEGNIPKRIPLHYIFPIAKGRSEYNVLSRGTRNGIGKIDNVLQPMFIFSDVIGTAYDESLSFDHIFIDATTIKKNINMNMLSAEASLFFDNYFDFRIPYIVGENTGVFAFEEYKTNDISFIYVPSDFEEEIQDAFKLLKKIKNDGFPSFEIRIINKILNNILRTSIDGVEYDFIAKFSMQSEIIKDLINELKVSECRFSNKSFEMIIRLVEDIYNKCALDSFCPKFNVLIRLCEKYRKNGKNVLIVVASKIDSIGLKEKIAQHFRLDINDLNINGFEIVTLYNAFIMNSSTFDNVIITSCIKFNDLTFLKKSLGKKITVILYQIEIRELKTRLYNLIKLKNQLYYQGLASSEMLIYEILYRKLKNVDVGGKKVLSDFSIYDLIESIEKINIDYSIRLDTPYLGENSIKVKLITFEDESRIFMRVGASIQFRKKSSKKIEKKLVKDLKHKDEVIIIDGDAREDIYKVFISSVGSESESSKHYEVIKKWNYLFEDKFIFLKIDLNSLYEKMVKNGWNKTTKAILNNWKSGYSFGPRDKEDIICLGKALNIEEFIYNYEYYHCSMRYIRKERRLAAKVLNKIIFYGNKKLDQENSDILEKYNLTIEELHNVISINRVKSVSEEFYIVKPTEIGKIF